MFPFRRLIPRSHAAVILLALTCSSLPGCSALPKNLTPRSLAAIASPNKPEDDKIRQAALADSSFPAANQPAPKTANIER
jgi:hypothetical protein